MNLGFCWCSRSLPVRLASFCISTSTLWQGESPVLSTQLAPRLWVPAKLIGNGACSAELPPAVHSLRKPSFLPHNLVLTRVPLVHCSYSLPSWGSWQLSSCISEALRSLGIFIFSLWYELYFRRWNARNYGTSGMITNASFLWASNPQKHWPWPCWGGEPEVFILLFLLCKQ